MQEKSRHTTLESANRRFGRMFPDLPSRVYNPESLQALAESMVDATPQVAAGDLPGVPAMYTYFGQFVDHDMTRDAAGGAIAPAVRADELPTQLATPTLDLDCLYGANNEFLNGEGKFTVGILGGACYPGSTGKVPLGRQDVPRNLYGIAQIADPRNEDNMIVSAIHLLFMQFHNSLIDQKVRDLATRDLNRSDVMAIKRQVVRYYQAIILKDYLPRILSHQVLSDVQNGIFKAIVKRPETVFMPLEFSGAAYRFGHAMVREMYSLNEGRPEAHAMDLLQKTGLGKLKPPGMLQRHNWRVDWQVLNRNNARRINTYISPVLSALPHSGGGNLAYRNLARGAQYGLPSGQAVAEHLGYEPLYTSVLSQGRSSFMRELGLDTHTPLWFYLLAEAEHSGEDNGHRMGEVGSTIVAETFYWLIDASATSVLRDPLNKGEVPGVDCSAPSLQAVIDAVDA